jgi:hypothetical protein
MVAGRAVTPGEHADADRLKEYWAHGDGRKLWIDSPHPYATLHTLLLKYVSPAVADGLAANIFKLATGEYPGQRAKGQRL